MYTFDVKVRYSELNEHGEIRPESIVNYLQDCTTFHTATLGATEEFYRNAKKLWVLNAWQIEINEPIVLGEDITVGTWPYEFSGMYGYRNFIIKNKMGKNIVEANSVWVFADMETGRPAKLTEEYTNMFVLEEKLDMNYADRKVKLPTDIEGKCEKPIIIRKAFIDSNGHVNNGRYIECAAEYIPNGCKVKRIRAEYKRQAKYGNSFCPVVYDARNENGIGTITIALNDENSRAYALVEFDISM